MKAPLLKLWDDVRSSYWFIPSLMTLGAIGLSFGAVYLDGRIGSKWLDGVSWLYANQPDGARAVLSTIASSMITVAGVTFSITIASVAYATGQFGPRLLTNFMQDRGNQVTLGTFIATFLYCLLVLRTIRSADEPASGAAPGADLVGAFVPHIAILVGIALTLASVGVLIFFIHHIPESIHISNVTAGIGHELNRKIETLFPQTLGRAPEEAGRNAAEDFPAGFLEEATPICAHGSGYIEHLDNKGLLHVAEAHDLLLRIEYRPGDFISEGLPLVYAWPPSHLDDGVKRRIHGAFAWGRQRTQAQDAMFLVNELVEIAGRALSPGVNDPFTAMSCMDWLGGALASLAGRDLPGPFRYGDGGQLRVIAHPITFEYFADAAFNQLRPYVREDRNAALHMMKTIGEVGMRAEREAHREVLLEHAARLKRGCEEGLGQQEDVELIKDRYRAVARLLKDPEGRRLLASERAWLAGSA